MGKPGKSTSLASEELLDQFQLAPLEADSSASPSTAVSKCEEIFHESEGTAELLKSILEWAVELLGVESGEIYLYDNHVQALKMSVVCGPMEKYYGVTLQAGEGLAGKVYSSREPIIVPDYNHWGGKAPKFTDEFPYQTELAIPLQWHERIIGVLIIVSDNRIRPITEADIRPTRLCANLVAAAIENARLYQELQNSLMQFKHTLEQEVAERTNEISQQAALAARVASTHRNAFSDLNTDELLTKVVELRTTKKVLTQLTKMSLETPSIRDLTPREIQILSLVGQGFSNKEIACCLKIAVSTVKFHVGSLLSKLNLPDRTQAALWSVRVGIVKQETKEP